MENYEQKYKEALGWMQSLYDGLHGATKEDAEHYFPELKESEDERIRKSLINFLKSPFVNENITDEKVAPWITWLEKRGKQSSEPKWYHHKVDLSDCSEEYRKAYYDGWNNCNMQHSQREAESNNEDERMRKEIIDFLRLPHPQFVGKRDHEKWITWLEKQKDYIKFPNSAYTSNKDVIEFADKYSHDVWEKLMDNFKKIENYSIGCNDVSDIVLNAIINTYNWLEKQDKKKSIFNADDWYVSEVDGKIHNAKFIEKQDGEKPTDEVEPKFKPGDWIVFNGLTLHIDKVVNGYPYGYYRTTSRGDGIHNSYDWDIDNAARLWTIEDAKDGDVIVRDEIPNYPSPFIAVLRMRSVDTFSSHCFVGFNGNFYKGEVGHSLENLHPATKEQRELLFQKMEEAGCKWDSVCKKLTMLLHKQDM